MGWGANVTSRRHQLRPNCGNAQRTQRRMRAHAPGEQLFEHCYVGKHEDWTCTYPPVLSLLYEDELNISSCRSQSEGGSQRGVWGGEGAAASVKCRTFTLVWCARYHAEGQCTHSLGCRKKAGFTSGDEFLLSHYSWASLPLAPVCFLPLCAAWRELGVFLRPGSQLAE